MKTIIDLTKRNLLLFFRNKSQVFFSFLSVIIIIGLYVLFLSDLQVENIKASMGNVSGVTPLVNSWIMAGLIAVSTVTVSLGTLGRIVADRETKSINDFLISPINRTSIFISYILSTIIITLILSIIVFILAEIYIVSTGGAILTLIQIIKSLEVIILCVLSSSLILLFIVSYLKSEQTLSILATIIGTMIGFVTGTYIPMGIMPKSIQFISNIIPTSQGASLLRKIFLEKPISEVFNNAPKEVLVDYKQMQGIDLYLGNTLLSPPMMIGIIVVIILIFTIINIWRFKKLKI